MTMNSVQTNIGAMVALQSLNRTNEEMAATQKRISTGFRVADAKDDGAAYAVAQRVRGDIAGLGAANEQLGSTKGLLETTLGALNEASKNLTKIRETLTKLSSDTLSESDRETYTKDFENLVNQTNRALGDASYNGRSLLGSQDSNKSNASTAVDTGVVRNERGNTLNITGVDASTLTFDTRVATGGRDIAGTFENPVAFTFNGGTAMTSEQARVMLGNGDASATGPLQDTIAAYSDEANFGGGAAASNIKTFATVELALNTALSKFGADARDIDGALSTNRQKMDSMESGLGSLVDADLAKESARLQALQIRQQLGTQSLSIANQAPQALLSLFR
ncbi:flagellin [Roseococcus sp. SDR]|uniref:flagellin n=1 Tax=Roseococcus sp. SDR TaxID=2835532 RepID=UPI001BD07FBF|nr:flagellin [Roseococcus sp. SDR]MBS7791341.1 flagellin [Roseococcus sp. SDR]MBV1846655.1 flagellin [Roseococcus sp. SDR]